MSWYARYCGAIYYGDVVAPNGDEYGVEDEQEALALVAKLNAAEALADAVATYFNKRGAKHAERAGNEDIATIADALAEYSTPHPIVSSADASAPPYEGRM